MHDVPYTRGVAGPEVTACMTSVAREVRRVVGKEMTLGIQILSCMSSLHTVESPWIKDPPPRG